MRTSTIGLVAVLLFVIVETPLVMADDTIVGVVYRGWTNQQCEKEFGKNIISNKLPEGVPPNLQKFKGPLLTARDGAETSCYCKDDYVMRDDKKSCTKCEGLFSKNYATYATNTGEAVPDAVLRYKGEDIGCRCKAKLGDQVFDEVVNNVCKYRPSTARDDKCNAKFPGSKECGPGEERYVDTTEGIKCCCRPGFKAENGVCVEPVSANDEKACKDKYATLSYTLDGDESAIGVCENQNLPTEEKEPGEMEKKWLGNALSPSSSDPYGRVVQCCCASGYQRDPSDRGRCKSTKDECTNKVTNSVKKTHFSADSEYPITKAKGWDRTVVDKLQRLSCNCKKGYVPSDTSDPKDGDYDACEKLANKCEDVIGGSVGQEAEDSEKGQKIGGAGWDDDVLKKIEHLNCWCKKGYGPIDASDPKNGYDSCGEALENVTITCKDYDDYAQVMIKGSACYNLVEGYPADHVVLTIDKKDGIEAAICGVDRLDITSAKNSLALGLFRGAWAATGEVLVDLGQIIFLEAPVSIWGFITETIPGMFTGESDEVIEESVERELTAEDLEGQSCADFDAEDWIKGGVLPAGYGIAVADFVINAEIGKLVTDYLNILTALGGPTVPPEVYTLLTEAEAAQKAGRNMEALTKLGGVTEKIPASLAARSKTSSLASLAHRWYKLENFAGRSVFTKPLAWSVRVAAKIMGKVGGTASKFVKVGGKIVAKVAIPLLIYDGVRNAVKQSSTHYLQLWAIDNRGNQREIDTEKWYGVGIEPFMVEGRIKLEAIEPRQSDPTHEYRFIGLSDTSNLILSYTPEEKIDWYDEWNPFKGAINFIVDVNLQATEDKPLLMYTCTGYRDGGSNLGYVRFEKCTRAPARLDDVKSGTRRSDTAGGTLTF